MLGKLIPNLLLLRSALSITDFNTLHFDNDEIQFIGMLLIYCSLDSCGPIVVISFFPILHSHVCL